MASHPIIILANGLNGIGAIHSAAAAGLTVVAVLTSARDTAASSRLPRRKYVLEHHRPEALRSVLEQVAAELGPASVLACSDESAQMLSSLEESGELAPHATVMPHSGTVRLLNDKKLECERMMGEGVELPPTYLELADLTLPGPLIIKPRTWEGYQVLGAKNLIVEQPAELEAFTQRFQGQLDAFIAQDIIPGPDENLWVCNVVFDRGSELVSFFSFNRLGTMPSHYGVTSLAVSRYHEALHRECAKIGKALGYTGPAMIEFKQGPKDGRYYYIETNPRVGMCNWFDSRCGVNNVLASHQVALGLPVAPTRQRDGLVYWNPLGDWVARLEDREPTGKVLARYGRLLWRRKVFPVFTWRDPVPSVRHCLATLRSLAGRLVARFR